MAFWVTTHEGLIEEEAKRKELSKNVAPNIFEGAVTFQPHGEEERAVEGKAKEACQRVTQKQLAP